MPSHSPARNRRAAHGSGRYPRRSSTFISGCIVAIDVDRLRPARRPGENEIESVAGKLADRLQVEGLPINIEARRKAAS